MRLRGGGGPRGETTGAKAMNLTRIDSKEVKKKVDEAAKHLEAASEILAGLLLNLTAKQRQALIHPPSDFDKGARALARAMGAFKDVAAATDFNSEAVVEDLDNAAVFAPLEEKIT